MAAFIPELYYRIGNYTNCSMGISAYACFAAIGFYSILTMALFLLRARYIQKNKRTAFVMSQITACMITLLQVIWSERKNSQYKQHITKDYLDRTE